jgi:hypothetical protein
VFGHFGTDIGGLGHTMGFCGIWEYLVVCSSGGYIFFFAVVSVVL